MNSGRTLQHRNSKEELPNNESSYELNDRFILECINAYCDNSEK